MMTDNSGKASGEADLNMINDYSGERVLRQMYTRSVLLNLAGALTLMINSVFDGVMICHFLGLEAQAAYGLIFPLFTLVTLVPIMLRSATEVKVGSLVGRGSVEEARQAVRELLVGAFLLSLPFVLAFSLAREQVMVLLGVYTGATDEIVSMVSDYLLLFAPSVIPLYLTPVLHPLMQFDGDSRRSPAAIVISLAVNIIGDIFCVLQLGSGMAGIAAATTLSCFTECAVLILHFRKEDAVLRPQGLSRLGDQKGASASPEDQKSVSAGSERQKGIPAGFDNLKEVLRMLRSALVISLPILSRETTAFVTGILINILTLSTGGKNTLAVLAAGNAIWPFLLSFPTAASNTGLSLGTVSESEEDHRAVRTILRLGILFAAVPCTAAAIVFALFSGRIARFITTDPEILSEVTMFLYILAAALPATVLTQITESHLMVIKRNTQAVILCLLDGGLAVLIASLILLQNYGAAGIYTGRLTGVLICGLAALIMIWKSHETSESRESLKSRETSSQEHTYQERAYIEATLTDNSSISDFADKTQEFCKSHGVSGRNAFYIALCIEELAENVVMWGSKAGQKPEIDVRVVVSESDVKVRIRDNGKLFNAERYAGQFVSEPEDPSRNIGIRIVSRTAASMNYVSLVDFNVLLLTFK